jgi:hypothetical protein
MEIMVDKHTVAGLALVLIGAALLAAVSVVQVGMGWAKVDRLVEKGLEQSAVWSQ